MTTPPTNPSFPGVTEFEPDQKEHRRKIARVVNRINGGKINCVLDVTLRANQVTTVITDPRLGSYSAIFPAMALTASGAAAIAAGIYVDTVTTAVGTTTAAATIHHASNAAADQKIRFVILG